mmetsp:Transcript_67079/g.135208  ORF Transcript_67079/g.135208 Transcript_67079/m.135208 type:complete len:207 (+) Transcript_67079:136-756(+)
MLFAVPTRLRDVAPWVLSTVVEIVVATTLWNIDNISDEVHAVTTSRWHIDPGATSSSCSAPVEVGKLAAVAFAISVAGQFLAVIGVQLVERVRARNQPIRSRSAHISASSESDVVLEGLPEFLYVCHGILGFVVSGGIFYRALNLLLRNPLRFRFCPHRKVVGIFKFACLATMSLSTWYFTIVSSASRAVFKDLLGDNSSRDTKRK